MDNFKDFFGKRKLQLEAKLDRSLTKDQARQRWVDYNATLKGAKFTPEEIEDKIRYGSFVPEDSDLPSSELNKASTSTPLTSTGTLGLRTANTDQLAKDVARARANPKAIGTGVATASDLAQGEKLRNQQMVADKGLGVITNPEQIAQMEKEGLVYFSNAISDSLINATKLGFPYYGYMKNGQRVVRPVPETAKR
jgi:hypothetical protein